MPNNQMLVSSLQKICLVLLSIGILIYPLTFSTLTTDAFALPKQVLIGTIAGLVILLYAISLVVEKKVSFRATPFDLPVFLFVLAVLLSGLFAANRFDSLISFFPLLFAVLFYFAITNIVKRETDVLFFVSAVILGGVLSGLVSVLAYFNVYLIPLASTHVQTFTTFGSLLDQALYLAVVLPLSGYLAVPAFQRRSTILSQNNLLVEQNATPDQKSRAYVFVLATIVLIISLGLTIFQLATKQQPLILPFSVGFQTAFAAISQDTNVLKGFLLGSGFGTYITDFTRFKPASFNANQTLWSFTFFRSSSFFLELIATTGVLGLATFLFLSFKILRQGTIFLPMIIAFIAALLLPFSPVIYSLFFIILGVFACLLALHHPTRFPELEFHFVALRHGLFTATTEGEHLRERSLNRFLPICFALILLILVGTLSYLTGRYVYADYLLQNSLQAAAQNNGKLTYDLQLQSINVFPFRDASFRTFASTNMAIANALVAGLPKNSQPDQALQKNVLQLIQQSIDSGRTSITLSPQTAMNWDGLSQTYRALLNFGQGADKFSIVTSQQAIALDGNNPEQYINLGGIYYQLGDWDNAIQQFSTAISKKGDFANAYYNVGHAFEQKSDFTDAMQAYQIVQKLVANDPTNKPKIDADVAALQQKIDSQNKQQAGTQATIPTPPANAQAQNQQPLGVNNPGQQLPPRNPKATILGPTISPLPTVSTNPSPTKSAPSSSPVPSIKS